MWTRDTAGDITRLARIGHGRLPQPPLGRERDRERPRRAVLVVMFRSRQCRAHQSVCRAGARGGKVGETRARAGQTTSGPGKVPSIVTVILPTCQEPPEPRPHRTVDAIDRRLAGSIGSRLGYAAAGRDQADCRGNGPARLRLRPPKLTGLPGNMRAGSQWSWPSRCACSRSHRRAIFARLARTFWSVGRRRGSSSVLSRRAHAGRGTTTCQASSRTVPSGPG